MNKKRPRSVTVIAAICIVLSLIGIVYYSSLKVRVGYDPLALFFLIWWITVFVVAIGLLRGSNSARQFVMFFSTLLVIVALLRVLIVIKTWQYELYLGGDLPASLNDGILTLLGIFSIFIFWIAVLFVMNKPSVKSFFRPTQDIPEKKG